MAHSSEKMCRKIQIVICLICIFLCVLGSSVLDLNGCARQLNGSINEFAICLGNQGGLFEI